ncbi:TonB-dependent receptor P39 [Bacteroides eggerthii]|uniref:TonB-dependent receptor P39 n=1 Tax=Bacteroides eggerthii TaxID=28111 RepID=A0A975KHA7_9BACE|nr:TonB-dependent receptor P39 [Bacteroides eggerthii]
MSSAKTLQISYIGMQTQEVAIKPRVQVTLKSDSEMLDEVVVVAYGTASRQSITGAVASIDSKKLEMRPVTEVTGTLEGAAPGIQVNNSYGEPGSDKSEIRIRGFGSVNGTNAPLIVVDGSPYGGSLNDINPQDIESISVLKDASSAALYGNKAANGVIMITTKKGKSHKLNFRIGVKQGMYTRGIPEYEKLGVNQWMEAMRSGMQSYYQKNAGMPAEQAFEASKNVNSVVKSPIFDKSGADMFDENGKLVAKVKPGYNDLDWLDALERTGYRQEYTASADAMGDKYDVFSSFGYLNEKGYIIGSDYDRFTARLKANYQPTSWFKTGVSLSGTMSGSNYQATAYDQYYANPFYTAGQMAPVYPYMMHNEDGSIATDENGNSYDINNYRYLSGRNIIYEIQNDVNRKERNAVSGQVYGTISFLKDFAATVRGDLYNVNNTEKSFNNPYCGDGAANNGRLSKMHARTREYRFTQELTWGHDFDKHHIDVLLAHESFKHSYNYDFMMKEQMKVSDNIEMSNFAKMTSIDGYTQEYTTESYLSRARYNFAERYFMDASFRRDGSSRFYEPWGNFWSLGASWIISQEKFMKDLTWIDNLKFRVSYGEVGNDAGADYYAYKELFYSDVNAGIGAFYKIQIPNKNLKWETSGSLDIALEGRLFNRFNFSLDFFNKTSKDLLFLKSATKPLNVLIAFTRPLITEFADNLNLKHPLLPTISPYPTM